MFTVAKLQAALLVKLRSCCLPTQMQHQTCSSPSKECHCCLQLLEEPKLLTGRRQLLHTKVIFKTGCISRQGHHTYLVPWSDSHCWALCRDCGVQKSCTGTPPWYPAIIWLWWCCGAWVYTVTMAVVLRRQEVDMNSGMENQLLFKIYLFFYLVFIGLMLNLQK